MPRANRYYIPGYVWHITHRCHKKEFLLKFAKDQRLLLSWLFEAKKRHGLSVLNYAVTSNHIHLLVRDNGERDVIPASLQLVASRMAQAYNQRKDRKGAYWEDRYHATAVETDRHLVQCLVYMDLNMVRAGVVRHPSEWPSGGYHEIQDPPKRYSIIDHAALHKLLGFGSLHELAAAHWDWIDEALKRGDLRREGRWSESIAVGSEPFVRAMQTRLGIKGHGREVIGADGSYKLREAPASYTNRLGHENDGLRLQNGYFWDHPDGISAT